MNSSIGLTFDDLLLVPQKSSLSSRSECDLTTWIGPYSFSLPVVSSPMDTVTNSQMAVAMAIAGGLGIIHRGQTVEEQTYEVRTAKSLLKSAGHSDKTVGAAIGSKPSDHARAKELVNAGAEIICIDVSHGHHDAVAFLVKQLKKDLPTLTIIAGNVATAEGARFLSNEGVSAIRVGIGNGCFAAGTRILLSNGTYKDIEKVVAGDRVINKNGDPVTVKKSFSTGFKKVTSIRTTSFYEPTILTDDHRLWVYDCNESSETSFIDKGYKATTEHKSSFQTWKPVKDLANDIILAPSKINFELSDSFNIEIPKLEDPLIPSYELGYIFGTFLGDGHSQSGEFLVPSRNKIQKQGRVVWSFGLHETEIASKLESAIELIFGPGCTTSNTRKNCLFVNLNRKFVADLLMEFGKRTSKHLPEKFMCLDKDYLQGIYDGLVDSDGHIEKHGRISFANTSKSLIELFDVISVILYGSFPNHQKLEKTTGNLINCNSENLSQAYSSRRNSSYEKRILPEQNLQLIKTLDKTEVETIVEVFDLEIDDDTHSFIANNMSVHNSICSTRLNCGHGVPQVFALSSVASALRQTRIPHPSVISDGGCKTPGDVIKAIALGSDMVMLGSMLAGTDASPGDVIVSNGQSYKSYRGMASKESQQDWAGAVKSIEGISAMIPYKGTVSRVLADLKNNLKAGLSYSGAKNITEFQSKAQFIRISGSAVIESNTHILERGILA